MIKIAIKIIIAIRNIILLLFVLSLLSVILYKYIPVYYTSYMFAKNAEQLFSAQKVHIRHQWKPLSEISPALIQAIIASEDYLFLIHNGFDANKENRSLNRGTLILYQDNPTISQQTAGNVFLLPGKNYLNTVLETYFTILIEFIWGKKRILEVYLNSIEMGNAIFGAEAISQKIFNKPARMLDNSESALIAACLISPDELNPSKPTSYILRRQAKIMGIMEEMLEIPWLSTPKY